MLGPSQDAWLAAQLRRSTTRWNLVTQQTLVSPFNRGAAAAPRWWTDGWDGYPAARDRMLADIAASGAANPLILGGDMHAFFVADVARRQGGP
ncbi:alkaline phosphatase D family protein, partial [Escherichia coli]